MATATAIAAGELLLNSDEYLGYTLKESTGSAGATVILYDSATAASGPILDIIVLAAGASSPPANYPKPGRTIHNGIYAAITGSVIGSIFT